MWIYNRTMQHWKYHSLFIFANLLLFVVIKIHEDVVFLGLVFSHVILSGGVLFSQTSIMASSTKRGLVSQTSIMACIKRVKIHQRGVQWKTGVAICMLSYTSLLYNTTHIRLPPPTAPPCHEYPTWPNQVERPAFKTDPWGQAAASF